ncbi:hypothetical protein PIB30_073748 [Stylosanthes scabra]|uniref:Uncharacterized protein n=1 Tax=Stylosanthes scabra TaxID=79078 RepID=A0ABU6XQU7_9FABA|nr:hypothetical protein [Stylosanthes scabra]
MPKKAIVASSRGKGLRLALPGPIKQSQLAQESGSTTQQSSKKPTELSTQQSQSQSTQQAKQTKADYAFPIQTLMVLQDQEKQITQKHSQSCKGMLMSNGDLNLIHQWPIQKRSENGSKTIPRVKRYQIQQQYRFSIRKHKSKQP